MSAIPESIGLEPVTGGSGRGRRRLARSAIISVCLAYLSVLILAPLAVILLVALRPGWHIVAETFGQADLRHAFLLTVEIALTTVTVTALFGMIVAWVLARQRFIGRSVMNALVDLPLAVSPVTVGLAAILLFGRGGWFEPFFAARGIQVVFALPSMVIVTIFISLPFVIREVVPVLEELGTSEEDAARTLGASSTQSFLKVTLPNIRWGLWYGIALTTARAIGEIGAVLIVSGMIQGQTETATLYIYRALENRDTASAYMVALALAAISVILLGSIEFFKRRATRKDKT